MIAQDLLPLARDITTLHADPHNVRLHNARNLEAIKASLSSTGQVKPVVVTASGMVLAGNGTLAAAQALGWSHLAAVAFTGSPAEARRFALADNRTAELAEWDWEGLAGQFRAMEADGIAFDDLGWAGYEIEPLLQAQWVPPVIDETPTEPPAPPRHGEPDEPDEPAAPHGGGDAQPPYRAAVSAAERAVAASATLRALEALRARGEEGSDGELLELLCAEWLEANG